MNRKFTLLILLFFPIILFSQNLTGIWRGYFIQKDFDPKSGDNNYDTYKYEVQINQLADNSLDGVTYSYKRTEYYGKASLHGLAKTKAKNVIIKEIRLIEHHSTYAELSTCLMTCYLDYVKRGKLELMTGTYTSINTNPSGTGNCGEGTVYLEKVEESDFDKESFLTKKNKPSIKVVPKTNTVVNTNKKGMPKTNSVASSKTNATAKINPENTLNKKGLNNNKQIDNQLDKNNKTASKNAPHPISPVTPVDKNAETIITPNSSTRNQSVENNVSIGNANKIKPGAEMFVLKNNIDNEMDTFYKYKIDTTVYVYDSPNNKHSLKNKQDSAPSMMPDKSMEVKKLILEDSVLKPLVERETILANTIQVDEKEVRIDYYDNGEIDNDTISVFDNSKKVVTGGRLSYSPITLNLTFSKDVPVHQIITVAENLGDIPPNTALMVITFGKKRFEVNITSDEKTNAKVILEYNGKLKLK